MKSYVLFYINLNAFKNGGHFILVFLGLEDARGILEFQNEAAKIESWIRDKELMISQGKLS